MPELRVLYFASLRERLGRHEDHVTLPDDVVSIRDLAVWLGQRDTAAAAAFADPSQWHVAIDQTYSDWDGSVCGAREIAFFPPVTGG